MSKRNVVMEKIKQIFARYGYDPIETPILNPAATILGKYGEEGDRLTYNFEDNGKRRLALPYDLTVPFARYFAANWKELPLPFKRYQIQRVWRGEKPTKGRLREFYQCDIDVIGTESLIAEAEVARVITTVFTELGFKNFQIKTNSRAAAAVIAPMAPRNLLLLIACSVVGSGFCGASCDSIGLYIPWFSIIFVVNFKEKD